MNKSQLINVVAKDAHLTKRAAADAVDTIFNEITRQLSKGQQVSLSGFGSFERIWVEDKEVVPFGDFSKKVKVKGHGKVAFRPGRPLKQATW